jgi:hypothetical protein
MQSHSLRFSCSGSVAVNNPMFTSILEPCSSPSYWLYLYLGTEDGLRSVIYSFALDVGVSLMVTA